MRIWTWAELFFGICVLQTAAAGYNEYKNSVRHAGHNLNSNPPGKKIFANKGDDVRLLCKVQKSKEEKDLLNLDQLKIRWKHNGHYLHPDKSQKYTKEDNGQALLIKDVNAVDGGQYACIVSRGFIEDVMNGVLIIRQPPDPPKDVRLNSCVGNFAEVTWTPGKDGGSKILQYQVQFNTSESPQLWNHYYDNIDGKELKAYINLSPWGTYSFRVLAKSEIGFSLPSAPTKETCTTPPERPAGNPRDVRTQTHKHEKLIISWTPMRRLLHNGPGFKYTISWRRKGSTYWHQNSVESSDANEWEVSVNDTYALYEIKVKAANQLGDSHQPAFIYLGRSGEGVPKVIPKDFRVDPSKPIEEHKAYFIWEAVDTSVEKIQGEFKGYKLRYWKSSEGRHKKKEVDIFMTKSDHGRPDVRACIDKLPAYTALRAQVLVMNTHNTGPPSETIDFVTPEGVPDPVRNLHIDSYGATFTLLKWLPPEEPNGQLLGYDIGYQQVQGFKKGPIKALQPQIDSPDTLGARITGLSPNHDYRFYVWARSNAGIGEPVFLDVKTEDGYGQDAHPFQQQDSGSASSENGSSSFHQSIHLTITCHRTRTLFLQTILSLLMIYLLIH